MATNIRAGNAGGADTGHALSMFSGEGGPTGEGGNIIMRTGDGGSTLGNAGRFQFFGGSSSSGNGGSFLWFGGNAGTTGVGGNMTMVAGNGSGTGNGGIITIRAGDKGASGAPGYVLLDRISQDNPTAIRWVQSDFGSSNYVSVAAPPAIAGSFNLLWPNAPGVANTILKQVDGTQFEFDFVDLSELGDVVLTAPANNHVLTYDGTNWVNSAAAGATVVTEAPLTGVGSGGDPIGISDGVKGNTLRFDGVDWQIRKGVFDAVVGDDADCDFATVTAAIAGGCHRLAVVGLVAEPATTTVLDGSTNLYLKIFPESILLHATAVPFIQFAGVSTGGSVVVEGGGAITWNPSAISVNYINGSTSQRIVMRDVSFTNSSTNANTQLTNTVVNQSYDNVRFTAGNAASNLLAAPSAVGNNIQAHGCTITGGGASNNDIVEGWGWRLSDTYLEGTFSGTALPAISLVKDGIIDNLRTGSAINITLEDSCRMSNSRLPLGGEVALVSNDNILSNTQCGIIIMANENNLAIGNRINNVNVVVTGDHNLISSNVYNGSIIDNGVATVQSSNLRVTSLIFA